MGIRASVSKLIDETDFRVILSSITFIVFSIFLGVIFNMAKECDPAKDCAWMDLFKTGFTTLGAAFTFIIGFYFGQKSKN